MTRLIKKSKLVPDASCACDPQTGLGVTKHAGYVSLFRPCTSHSAAFSEIESSTPHRS